MSVYEPEFTRDHPLLSATENLGVIHAWYETLRRNERRGPTGSRSLCGKRTTGWCRNFDGFAYTGAESIRSAESISWFGSMCPDCLRILSDRTTTEQPDGAHDEGDDRG